MVQLSLPSFLLRDVRVHIYSHHLLAVPALSGISFFPLKELCLRLRTTIALLQDIICHRGDPAEDLYFIDFGTVVASLVPDGKRSSKNSASITPHTSRYLSRAVGGFFGEEILHCEPELQRCKYTVEAMNNCHLFYLSLNQWKSLANTFPNELGVISKNVPTRDREGSEEASQARGGGGRMWSRMKGLVRPTRKSSSSTSMRKSSSVSGKAEESDEAAEPDPPSTPSRRSGQERSRTHPSPASLARRGSCRTVVAAAVTRAAALPPSRLSHGTVAPEPPAGGTHTASLVRKAQVAPG